MTKRSAITMAAGLAAALLIGVVAISLMSANVSVATAGDQRKPVIKRQVQTVTVHRKAQTDDSPTVRVIDLGSGSAATSSMGSGSLDDGSESEMDSSFDDGASVSSHGDGGSSQGHVGDD